MKWSTAILLALLVVLLWGVEHARRNLWEPDEARYAYVAQEMIRDGHWAVPYRHGEYYAHKPPLYFWLIRGVVSLTGAPINGITARIPSLIASFISLLVTGLFARRLFDKRAVWPSMLVLATCFLFWHEAGMGRMDSVLLALELCSVYLLVTGDDKDSSVRRAVGYCCMGLGVLTKGPVGLLVPLIVYIVLRKLNGQKLFARHVAWGVPLALLFPLFWLGAAWMEGAPKEYFQELIFKQNFGRVLGKASFGKPRPVYFFLVHVPAEFMPWTVFLPASIAALWRGRQKRQIKVLIGWAVAVLLFFTLSSGKRNLYVLLAYPAMALMVGGASGVMGELSRKWRVVTVSLVAVIMSLLGLGLARLDWLIAVYCRFTGASVELPLSTLRFLPSAAVLICGAVCTVYIFRRKGMGRLLVMTVAAVFILNWALVANLVFPALNRLKTPVEVVPLTRQYAEAGYRMIIYGSTSEIVPLYCGMSSICAIEPGELKQAMRDEGEGIIVFREKDWIEMRDDLVGIEKLGECSIGRKTMVLVRFWSK